MELDEMVPRLVRAALEGDTRSLQLLAKSAIKKLRPIRPDLADQVALALSHYGVGASTMRSVGMDSPPQDVDSRLSLVRVVEPVGVEPPVLTVATQHAVRRFLHEWRSGAILLAEGLNPPTSLLLTGQPGVGKTYLATWVASELGLPLLVLDLAGAVSAYLGKTGQNLKTVLDYARKHGAVLLLDEFDAVAKRRDDPSDLGELKRIVNVLLKELEDWPSNSVIIAATNHPDLLDRAIWRRFDKVLTLDLPAFDQRCVLLFRHLSNRLSTHELNTWVPVLAELLQGLSASAIVQFTETMLRRCILDSVTFNEVVLDEIRSLANVGDSKIRDSATKAIVKAGIPVSVRELAKMLQCSVGNAQRLMSKHKALGGGIVGKEDTEPQSEPVEHSSTNTRSGGRIR